jgi:hypothetical protein
MKYYWLHAGLFQQAIAEDLQRRARIAERREMELLVWDGRGWEHPSQGWRQVFRGENGGARD